MRPRFTYFWVALALFLTIGWSTGQSNRVQASGLHASAVQSLALSWFTVDTGGQIAAVPGASSGAYALSSTLGQPDASAFLQGERFTLSSGFWGAMAADHASKDQLFLPLIRVTP